MEVFKKGTIEPLLVALRDRLENVSDLSTVGGKFFYVNKKSDDSAVLPDTAYSSDPEFPMQAICMIDTTDADFVGGETYKLYLKYINGSEQPILGPIYFRVEDD